MMLLIEPGYRNTFSSQMMEMHQLRGRVFRDRLGWGVTVVQGSEADDFDTVGPVYLLLSGERGCVHGCVRLLPTTGPTMLRDVFPELLAGRPAPARREIWESSRFALDLPPALTETSGGLAMATYELFAGMIEFGLSRSLIDIVTVTDVRVERILRRAGWPLRRIAQPQRIGDTNAVAGYLEISFEALRSVRRAGRIAGPVLWAPVLPAIYTGTAEGSDLSEAGTQSLPDPGKGATEE